LDLVGVASDLSSHVYDNKEHLLTKLLNPGLHESRPGGVQPIHYYMSSMQGTDEVVLTEIFVESITQPGNKDTFDPKKAIGFKTRKGKVRPAKVDVLFTKKRIMGLYKTYMSGVKSLKYNPEVLPFESYIMDLIMKSSQADLRRTLFWGEFDENGTDTLDCFDGLITQILADIASGKIPSANVVDTNVITNNNAVAEYEKIMAEIPSNYFYGDMVCLTNRKMKKKYADDYRSKYNGANYNAGYDKDFLEGSNIEFVIEPNLDGFDRPLFVPKNNIIMLYDDESAMTDMQVDYDKRTRSIAVVSDYQAGVGYGIAELLWTNDGV
jgi:hypothetical protein